MRRIITACSVLTLSLTLGTFSGCGDDSKVGTIQDSEATKKADEAGRKGMEDFMKSKTQSKPGSKAAK